MYRSLRRISFLGITASASKSRTSPPILASTREGSKEVIRRIPLRPAFMQSQVVRASLPSGVTAPIPVTTTRRSPRSAKLRGAEGSAIGLAARGCRSAGDRLVARDDERERGLDSHLPVDAGHGACLSEEAAQLLDGHLDPQRIAREDGPPKPATVDPREEGELAPVFGDGQDRKSVV